MEQGRDDNGDDDEKDNPAEKRISSGENLAALCLDDIDRSHPREDHGSIFISLDPTHILEVVIS